MRESIGRTVIVGFSDPIKNQWCELHVPDGGSVYGEPKIGVRHPGCEQLADLSVEIDAFYCPKCRWNGRISGAWALGVINSCQHEHDWQPFGLDSWRCECGVTKTAIV